MDLLFHEKTKNQIDRYITKAAHAVLIIAPAGSGKGTIAEYIAKGLLQEENLSRYPYFLKIEPSDGNISISEIRDLQKRMSLKTIGKKQIQRVAVIEYADMLTIEAQNAFLKLLEEPPKDTVIIMTVNEVKNLLPTLRSRTRLLEVRPLSKDRVSSHFNKLGYKNTEVERAVNLSEGRVGLTAAILESEDKHPAVEAIDTAKEMLRLSPFERLIRVDELSKDKDKLKDFLEALRRISRVMLRQVSASGDNSKTLDWHKRLTKVLRAQDQLNKNAQPKLLLTDLFISL